MDYTPILWSIIVPASMLLWLRLAMSLLDIFRSDDK